MENTWVKFVRYYSSGFVLDYKKTVKKIMSTIASKNNLNDTN